MPYVNIQTAGKLTTEQKEQIADEVTSTIENVANKPRQSIYIMFQDPPRENWSVGGKLLD